MSAPPWRDARSVYPPWWAKYFGVVSTNAAFPGSSPSRRACQAIALATAGRAGGRRAATVGGSLISRRLVTLVERPPPTGGTDRTNSWLELPALIEEQRCSRQDCFGETPLRLRSAQASAARATPAYRRASCTLPCGFGGAAGHKTVQKEPPPIIICTEALV
jgi:hypothetical protein